MQSELIILLEEASREITGLVSKLSDNGVDPACTAPPPGELKALSGKLAQVGSLLARRSPAQPNDATLQAALHKYVTNLETLKRALGEVQDSLGKKRDRLKKGFDHLDSARAWVETFRATH